MTCTHLAELLLVEREDLKEEINRHKWFMSQQQGHDVGIVQATQDFLDHYMNAWAEGYKECYCHRVCQELNCEHRRKE